MFKLLSLTHVDVGKLRELVAQLGMVVVKSCFKLSNFGLKVAIEGVESGCSYTHAQKTLGGGELGDTVLDLFGSSIERLLELLAIGALFLQLLLVAVGKLLAGAQFLLKWQLIDDG